MATANTADPVVLPRVAITFCTQCKWLLRAAYFGQELLSTFGTTIGEVALIPATGGIFQVHLTYNVSSADGSQDRLQRTEVLIWDRKTEGGFPETKILKQLVRNRIDPAKNLGHSDSAAKTVKAGSETTAKDSLIQHAQATETEIAGEANQQPKECADCA